MTSHISETLLHQLSEFVAARTGLHFPRERWRDLVRGIDSAARELHYKDAESYIRGLLSSSVTTNQIETLTCQLTIGETYFFREMNSLQVLADSILPELIRARVKGDKHLRIWSAACSTGEEPYTLAILLDKLLPDIDKWQITISATDINPRSLRRAAEGVYGEWAFRSTPRWIREKYFKKTKGNRFEVSPRIKEMVTFSYLNLVEDAYPSLSNNTNGMDVILCRNALMYFTQEQAGKVIRHLNLSLVNGGWFIVSPVDVSQVLSSYFAPVNFPAVTLYRKDGHQPRAMGAPSFRLEVEPELLSPLPPDTLTAPAPEVVSPLGTVEHLWLEVDERPTPGEEARALYEQGYYEEAADKLLELIALNQGNNANALALLARAYANQGKLAEAFEWGEKAVAADKASPGLHYLLATILQEQDRAGEAVAALKRALYLDHDFVLAHFALGNITRQQNKAKESEKHFQNALALLRSYEQEDVLPESEGITAGRLREIIQAMAEKERAA